MTIRVISNIDHENQFINLSRAHSTPHYNFGRKKNEKLRTVLFGDTTTLRNGMSEQQHASGSIFGHYSCPLDLVIAVHGTHTPRKSEKRNNYTQDIQTGCRWFGPQQDWWTTTVVGMWQILLCRIPTAV